MPPTDEASPGESFRPPAGAPRSSIPAPSTPPAPAAAPADAQRSAADPTTGDPGAERADGGVGGGTARRAGDRRDAGARPVSGRPGRAGSGRRRRTAGNWAAIALSIALVASAGAVAWWLVRDDPTDDPATDDPATSDPTGPAATVTVVPPATVADAGAPAVASSTTADEVSTSSVAPDPAAVVDLGRDVRFALPDGFTQQPVATGVEVSDGTVRIYAQVEVRSPGEDPLVALQQYVDTFDALYPSAAYSQTVALSADTTAPIAADGAEVRYRVLAADGSGYTGVVAVVRRADGLVLLTDTYVVEPAPGGAVPGPAGTGPVADAVAPPPQVAAELRSSFLASPAVGEPVALVPPTSGRITSVHAAVALDGTASVMPPVGWVDAGSAPGRVVVGHPTGERFVVVRVDDSGDLAGAQALATATVAEQWPGATVGGFTVTRDPGTGGVASADAPFTAADDAGVAGGGAIEGTVRAWFDAASGSTFVAVSSHPAGVARQPGHERFLFTQVDTALSLPR